MKKILLALSFCFAASVQAEVIKPDRVDVVICREENVLRNVIEDSVKGGAEQQRALFTIQSILGGKTRGCRSIDNYAPDPAFTYVTIRAGERSFGVLTGYVKGIKVYVMTKMALLELESFILEEQPQDLRQA